MLQLPSDWVLCGVLFLLLFLYSQWLTANEAKRPGDADGGEDWTGGRAMQCTIGHLWDVNSPSSQYDCNYML